VCVFVCVCVCVCVHIYVCIDVQDCSIKEWGVNIYNNLEMCTYGRHMLDFERVT
jgi:hypothetical protein